MRVEPLALLALLLAAPLAAEEEAPSPELLEFLGSFESADGQWLDPTQLDVPVPDQDAAAREGDET
ncbi:hypothetical protein [Sulfurivermis fontis]|jgi:hypothetical protein|uniref:hypothetical protein n=1 Tax=Sulfurivermis fontis TaxID=1972068 RepID=UPI000FD81C32|nr:hypothetical protein [Sulfurivermis fontis]